MSATATATAAKKKRRRKAKERRQLSLSGERAFKSLLRGAGEDGVGMVRPPQVCSEPWAEHIARHVLDETPLAVDTAGNLNAKPAAVFLELAKADLLPMPGQAVCEACGVPHPPHYLTSAGTCWDCHYAGMSPYQASLLPPSPSALAIRRIRELRARLEPIKTRLGKPKKGRTKSGLSDIENAET